MKMRKKIKKTKSTSCNLDMNNFRKLYNSLFSFRMTMVVDVLK